jgi:hypothetical protein
MKQLIRVGPAGWSYKDWEGFVYPEKPGPKFDFLYAAPSLEDTISRLQAFEKSWSRCAVRTRTA